jgi:hypothetical protein
LDEHQLFVSVFFKGRISNLSTKKLFRYAERLHLQVRIALRSIGGESAV